MPEIVIDATRLRDALRSTAHARAKGEERPILTWHWLIPWEHGLDVVAADNYRVARYRVTVGRPDDWPTCLLPAADADMLVAWLKGREDVILTLEGNVLVVTEREDSVRFRLAEGTPPDYAQVVEAGDPQPLVDLSAWFVVDAGKAAASVSPSGVVRVLRGTAETAPVVVDAGDYTEWIMPVRVPEGAL